MICNLLPGGLATPATVVFADRLERNLAGMAAFAVGSGVALRPHAKTHKCVQIAAWLTWARWRGKAQASPLSVRLRS